MSEQFPVEPTVNVLWALVSDGGSYVALYSHMQEACAFYDCVRKDARKVQPELVPWRHGQRPMRCPHPLFPQIVLGKCTSSTPSSGFGKDSCEQFPTTRLAWIPKGPHERNLLGRGSPAFPPFANAGFPTGKHHPKLIGGELNPAEHTTKNPRPPSPAFFF